MEIGLNPTQLTRTVLVRDKGEIKEIKTIGAAAIFLSDALAEASGTEPWHAAKKTLMTAHADPTEYRVEVATRFFESLCLMEGRLAR